MAKCNPGNETTNFKMLDIHKQRMANFDASSPDDIDYLLNTSQIVSEYLLDPPKERKYELIRQYCGAIDIPVPTAMLQRDIDMSSPTCIKCGSVRLLNQKNADLVCSTCGIATVYSGCSLPSFDQIKNGNWKVHYTYERKSHFKEELEQCQGNEQNTIPQEILDTVLIQCMKDKVTTMKGFKRQQMRDVLKRTGLSPFYKHSVKIIQLLGGDAGLDLSKYEPLLYVMFAMIQKPFKDNMHLLNQCRLKSTRQNFLNFRYTMRKFLELLNFDDYILDDYFPYLKNKKTLDTYDVVFKNICTTLGWNFIPSVNRV